MRSGILFMAAGIFALFVVFSAVQSTAQQKGGGPAEFLSWLPVTDGERALKAPVVEKDAGAEILLWRVHVVDEVTGNDLRRVFYHYVRLKIFDEKGKEKAATIDIDYREPGAVLDVSGRTIKADGSVLDLEKKAIYKRDLIRAGGRKQKAVSFAMPGVEPGSIVEYRWMQTEEDNRFRYLRLHFQREFPVQRITYFVKPLSREVTGGEQMSLLSMNSMPSPIKLENDGYSSTTLENVPAARSEPYSPSGPNLEPWALLYYREGGTRDADKFWSEEGKKAWKEGKDSVKVNEELKGSAAVAAASRAKTDDEKVAALIAGLHTSLHNLDDPGITTAEREAYFSKLPKGRNRTSIEIFKSGIASSDEMSVAFAALAAAAGMETHPVLIANRDEVAFNPKSMPDRYFVDSGAIAVKVDNGWKVMDVSDRFLSPGTLPWEREAVYALIGDPKMPSFTQTPTSPPEASTELRTARLALSADGSLEGDVEEIITGHRAEERRIAAGSQSPAQREEALRARAVKMFPDAEVTVIKLENVDDPAKPLRSSYHLKAPRYAQSTGKRLLFQPIAFRRAIVSPFSAADRKFAVEFPYAWKEIDQIHIQLPDGFMLDDAESPSSINFGKPGSYVVKTTVTTTGKPELYTLREFTFGTGGNLYFPTAGYASLKKGFDGIQVRDAYTMSLILK
jgi:hypothetical protein